MSCAAVTEAMIELLDALRARPDVELGPLHERPEMGDARAWVG